MSKPVVRVLHALARTGGTVFSRCLASMGGVALLSEIHPATRGVFDPADQARRWYGLEVPDLPDFADAIAAVEEACRARGLVLVVRAWDHVDYMPNKWTGSNPPLRSVVASALAGQFRVAECYLFRELFATWLSTRRYFASSQLECPSWAAYLCGYQAYLSHAAESCAAVSYDGFCADPARVLHDACELLELRYDPAWSSGWVRYRNVTGDVSSFDRASIRRTGR